MLFFMRLTIVNKLQLRSIQMRKIKTSFLKNLDNKTKIQPIESSIQSIENLQQEDLPKDRKVPKDLSIDNIIGQIHKGVSTRRHVQSSTIILHSFQRLNLN